MFKWWEIKVWFKKFSLTEIREIRTVPAVMHLIKAMFWESQWWSVIGITTGKQVRGERKGVDAGVVVRVNGVERGRCVGADPYWPHQAPVARCTPQSGQTSRRACARRPRSAASPTSPRRASGLLREIRKKRSREQDDILLYHETEILYTA